MSRAALLRNPLLAGFFMAVAFVLASCGGGGDDAPKPLKVAIYGDSIPFGYDLPVGLVQRMEEMRPAWAIQKRYAGSLRLQQLVDGYREPFDNAPAWTFPAGPQRPFVEETRAEEVSVVQTLVNDTFHDASNCEAHMRLVIATLLKEGRTPVLTGIVGMELDTFPPHVAPQWRACNSMTHALAAEYGLQHAGWDLDYRGPQDLKPDRVHRTQEGSDRLAALLVQAIERAVE